MLSFIISWLKDIGDTEQKRIINNESKMVVQDRKYVDIGFQWISSFNGIISTEIFLFYCFLAQGY